MISVILPVYNVEKYLHKCISSILNQYYDDFELIIVNDGSTDGSLTIIELFANNDKVRIYDQVNGGVSSARNLGIAKSTGKYCCFIDSDDYLEPDYLTKMVDAIESNNVDIACCGVYVGEKLDGSYTTKVEPETNLKLSKEDAILMLFSRKTFYGWPWNKIYKLDIIKNNNIQYDTKLKYCEDEVFVLEYLMQCNSLYFLKDILYHYMYNESSVNNKMAVIDKQFNYNALDRIKADQIAYDILTTLNNKEICNTAKARYFMSNVITTNKFFSCGYNGDRQTLRLLTSNLRRYYWYFITSKHWRVGFRIAVSKTLLTISPKLYYYLKLKK